MVLENIMQLFKFTAVGCVNTFIDWAVYFTVLTIFPGQSILFYTIAKGFSYFCGMVNSFLLNRCWTFKMGPGEQEGRRFVRFLLVNALGLGINSTSVYVFLHMDLSHFLALFLATAITFSLNFTLSKLWVFRKGKMVAKTTGG